MAQRTVSWIALCNDPTMFISINIIVHCSVMCVVKPSSDLALVGNDQFATVLTFFLLFG